MAVIFDAHVHLYHFFDLAKVVHCAHANFERILRAAGQRVEDAARLLLLTERKGQNFFREVGSGERLIEGCRISRCEAALRVDAAGAPPLFLLPGRQMACRFWARCRAGRI